MKPTIIITALIACGLLLSTIIQAQEQSKQEAPQLAIDRTTYRTAIGLRAGGTSGLTVKHFVSSYAALEGILGVWPSAFSITGLYEWNVPAGLEGLSWYYGGGAHVAFETGTRYYYYSYTTEGRRYFYRVYREGDAGFGVDGIVGIEYKIPPIPFALSLDLKPFIEVNTNGNAYLSLDPGLGIKVTF